MGVVVVVESEKGEGFRMESISLVELLDLLRLLLLVEIGLRD